MKKTHLKVVLATILALLCSTTYVALAQVVEAPEKNLTIREIISIEAREHNVSEEVMNKVINCESEYNPQAVGDQGHSYGLVQIHNLYHPEVTKAQALDPEFAIDFLATNLELGNGKLWSCYRKFYK